MEYQILLFFGPKAPPQISREVSLLFGQLVYMDHVQPISKSKLQTSWPVLESNSTFVLPVLGERPHQIQTLLILIPNSNISLHYLPKILNWGHVVTIFCSLRT